MPKYLLKVRYTGDGIQGVLRDGGSARRAAAQDLAKSVGGSIESFYFAFGEEDAYVICDLPDNPGGGFHRPDGVGYRPAGGHHRAASHR